MNDTSQGDKSTPPPHLLPTQPPVLPPLITTHLKPLAERSHGLVGANLVEATSVFDYGLRTPPHLIVAADCGSTTSSLTCDTNSISSLVLTRNAHCPQQLTKHPRSHTLPMLGDITNKEILRNGKNPDNGGNTVTWSEVARGQIAGGFN